MDENKGGKALEVEFHPVCVNAAFGVTLAAPGNASEPQQKRPLTWSSAV